MYTLAILMGHTSAGYVRLFFVLYSRLETKCTHPRSRWVTTFFNKSSGLVVALMQAKLQRGAH